MKIVKVLYLFHHMRIVFLGCIVYQTHVTDTGNRTELDPGELTFSIVRNAIFDRFPNAPFSSTVK